MISCAKLAQLDAVLPDPFAAGEKDDQILAKQG